MQFLFLGLKTIENSLKTAKKKLKYLRAACGPQAFSAGTKTA
jgi:hypothetical protein